VLQCVAARRSAYDMTHSFDAMSEVYIAVCCCVLQRVAVRCSALQCVVVRCSVLQCVAVRRSAYVRGPWVLNVCVWVCVCRCT